MKQVPAKVSRARDVFLVDDHPILRQGLVRMINEEADLHVCGEAASIDEALKGILRVKPDITIVDLSLNDMNGLDLIKQLHTKMPKMAILVLSMHKENIYAERAIQAGAKGYIMKQESPEHLLSAIRQTLQGEVYLSASMKDRLVQQLAVSRHTKHPASGIQSLSDRELEVFELIGKGRGSRQIAEELHLSIKTVETYRAHIKEKLQIANGYELARHAFEWVQSEGSN